MADTFIKSTNVNIFPTAYRNGYDPGAKFFSEENISNIFNSLLKDDSTLSDGFILNNPGNITDGSIVQFRLHGYWFKIIFNYSDFTNFISNGKIVARIQISDSTRDLDNKELTYTVLESQQTPTTNNNLDTNETTPANSLFTGIKFFDAYQAVASKTYQLLIAEWDTAEECWFIPVKSTYKNFYNINVNNIIGNNAQFHYISAVNNSGKYVWWMDHKGVFYNFTLCPQDNIATIESSDGVVTCLNSTGTLFEFDFNNGKVGSRVIKTSNTLAGLDSTTNTQEYKKINIYDDFLHISFEYQE